ncbi:MAG TPA: D-glycero-beta-D-manno-heptose 1-phosphate adenylyltransferase [Actinomycetota bacterium]|nr:D-glycero-beta-D-manno-heptose 1-phosphate adenylyltransferase [Actinomycetota bacterium]
MTSHTPGAAIDRFPDLHVVVVGDLMLDTYLQGSTRRVAQEAPVPVLDVSACTDAPGGAANTAANAAALGAQVRVVGLVGDDDEGMALVDALAEHGVGTDGVVADPGRRTLHKQRILADGQLLVRCDTGTTDPSSASAERALVRTLTEALAETDAVVVSDYGYGVATPAVLDAVSPDRRGAHTVLVADGRDLARLRSTGPTVVKPNYREAIDLLGLPEVDGPGDRAEQILEHGERLLDLLAARAVAVTLDAAGALLFERGAPPYRSYAEPTTSVRAAGAGDTFVAGLALALAAGLPGSAVVDLASAAAAVVTKRDGTSVCTISELRRRVATVGKVADLDALEERLAHERAAGRRIVFTNGCFDLLHRGHITYLDRAKDLGDVLVVGLNTDASVRRLKGPDRPVTRLEDRAEVLAALSCVDVVVPFPEDTPVELIRRIRPDVFVKGGDYTAEMLPEAEVVRGLGGEVRILPYVDERSTSSIIARIRATAEGAVA